jgi:hypothetical protein
MAGVASDTINGSRASVSRVGPCVRTFNLPRQNWLGQSRSKELATTTRVRGENQRCGSFAEQWQPGVTKVRAIAGTRHRARCRVGGFLCTTRASRTATLKITRC